MEQDTESWLGLRAERIAVFRRKLRRGGCPHRDIASVETVHAMVADGYTHIRSVPLPARDDPRDKSERLAWAKEQLSNVRELMNSYPGGYELRFAPSGRIPGNRLWSLVEKPGQQAEVLLTFTLTDQASGGTGLSKWRPSTTSATFTSTAFAYGYAQAGPGAGRLRREGGVGVPGPQRQRLRPFDI